jgi:colanic acid/amylovoran biosynthesis protein
MRSKSLINREKAKKICILGANFDNANLGVAALAYGSLTVIKHHYPDADIFILDYQKQPSTYRILNQERMVEIPVLNMRFSKNPLQSNHIASLMAQALLLRYLPIQWMREQYIRRHPYLKQLKETDLVFAISGGDSFSDIYGMKRMLYVSLPQLLALLLGKPMILLPQTIGPFKRWLSRRLASKILSGAEIVYSRDEEGLAHTRNLLGARAEQARIRFSPDVAFVVEPVDFQTRSIQGGVEQLRMDHRPVVGLNVSGLLYQGGYRHSNMFGLKSDYRELICDLVRLLIEKKRARVILIPHVLGEERHLESDRPACQEIYNSFSENHHQYLHMIDDIYKPTEIKHLIGQCDFFVGSRLHACIAALSQHVPAVGLAYSRKFAGVLKSAAVDDLVVDLRALSHQEVVRQVNRLFDERAALRQRLELSIPPLKDDVLHMFSAPVLDEQFIQA